MDVKKSEKLRKRMEAISREIDMLLGEPKGKGSWVYGHEKYLKLKQEKE